MKKYRKATAIFSVLTACIMLFTAFFPAAASSGTEKLPAISTFAKSQVCGELITFTEEDFTNKVSGDETLSAIVLSAMPETGVLRLAGRELQRGEAIDAENLSALCYIPANEDEVHTTFSFIPVFSKSGAVQDSVTVSLNVSSTPNSAPIACDMSFSTYVDLKLCGELDVRDPDGDPVTFTIVTQPKKGEAQATETGFVYIPASGKSGKDSFTYTATDKLGNTSKPATVTIEICKRPSKDVFSYTDMENSPAHFAAINLRDAGIFSGESFGGESFLYPDQTVSRAEFVAMVASLADIAAPTASIGTGLADNETIPVWAQPYVAAAIDCGVIHGEKSGDGNRVFRADDPITRAEAASILDRALDLTPDGREASFSDSIPGWASQAVVNTTSVGIVDVFSDNTVRCSSYVTREDAASMLYQAMCYLDSKDESSSFLFGLFD